MSDADAGVVHQDIHAAHQVNRLGKGGVHLFQVRNVCIERSRQPGQFA
jgi:hypothetical protein